MYRKSEKEWKALVVVVAEVVVVSDVSLFFFVQCSASLARVYIYTLFRVVFRLFAFLFARTLAIFPRGKR